MFPSSLEILKLEHGDYSCEILVNYGAALNSYQLKGFEFVDGYETAAQIESQQYKGVILAPFPNRIAEAKYLFQNRAYTLEINRPKEGLALHGFLYNCPFEVLEKTKESCVLKYRYSAEKAAYPFPFDLVVSYELGIEGALHVSSTLLNTGKENLPFGLGWHPYFKLESDVDHLTLLFPPCDKIELDDRKIPNGEKSLFCKESKEINLIDFHFDDCFELLDVKQSSFELKGEIYRLSLSGNSSSFPFFQIYTPKDRKSIAIEPMTCAPNAFNNLMGRVIVGPGEKHETSYTLQGLKR